MNKQNLRHYFSSSIEKEVIPSFETIRPLLNEAENSGPGQLKAALVFHMVFLCLAASIITAGFTHQSAFTITVAARYRESDFRTHAKEKFLKAENYLSDIAKILQGVK
jgi:hypothetical protein